MFSDRPSFGSCIPCVHKSKTSRDGIADLSGMDKECGLTVVSSSVMGTTAGTIALSRRVVRTQKRERIVVGDASDAKCWGHVAVLQKGW
jgi:hypothetical protein